MEKEKAKRPLKRVSVIGIPRDFEVGRSIEDSQHVSAKARQIGAMRYDGTRVWIDCTDGSAVVLENCPTILYFDPVEESQESE